MNTSNQNLCVSFRCATATIRRLWCIWACGLHWYCVHLCLCVHANKEKRAFLNSTMCLFLFALRTLRYIWFINCMTNIACGCVCACALHFFRFVCAEWKPMASYVLPRFISIYLLSFSHKRYFFLLGLFSFNFLPLLFGNSKPFELWQWRCFVYIELCTFEAMIWQYFVCAVESCPFRKQNGCYFGVT